jgi:hypothetical protein
VTHELTNDGGIQARKFPSAITTVTKSMHSGFGQTYGRKGGMQTINEHIRFAKWRTIP